jgi:hypothetical protein
MICMKHAASRTDAFVSYHAVTGYRVLFKPHSKPDATPRLSDTLSARLGYMVLGRAILGSEDVTVTVLVAFETPSTANCGRPLCPSQL